MADNFDFTPGSGKTGAADDISGVLYPRHKLIHGADGVNDGDVSNVNPLPIKIGDGSLFASIRNTGSNDSLNVSIVDASGNQITSFGGGTQYTEGDTDSSITGTALLWEDSSDTLRAVSVAKPLPVQVLSMPQTATQDTANQVDDAAFTPGTSRVLMIGAQLDNSSPDSVDEGDGGALRMSANRNLFIAIRDAAGNERGANVDASNRLSVTVDNIAAGTNTIGNVKITDGTLIATVRDTGSTDALNVAIVDASGNQITGFGGGNQYTEDDAFGGNGTGVFVLGRRDDALGTLTPVENDAVGMRVNNRGALWVSIADGSGNQITSFGGGTEYTEDAAAASDPVGKANILIRKDTPGATVSADGDNIAQRGTNYGAAYVQVVNSSGSYVDSFGGGTEYTEDAASAANPVGQMMMFRRRDTLTASEVSADSDNIAANATSKGELYVKHVDALTVASHAVTNAGTFAVQVDGAALTSLQLLDDVVVTDDAAFTPGTTKVLMVGAEFDDTTPDSVNEGDAGAVRMSANRNMYMQIRDAAGNERGVNVDASNRLSTTVDNLGSRSASGSIDLTNGSSAVTLALGGYGGVAIRVTGTWTGALFSEGSLDGTNFFSMLDLFNPADGSLGDGATIASNGNWFIAVAGLTHFRLKSNGIGTGTASAVISASLGNNATIPSYTYGQNPAGTTRGVMAMFYDIDSTSVAQISQTQGLPVRLYDDSGVTCMDDSNNALRVNIVAGAGSGGTAMADDAAFTVGTTSVTPVGYLLDDSSPDTVNEGDIGAPRMSANRVAYSQLRDAAGNERGANVDASNRLLVAATTAGDVAHDGADSGNPVKVGTKAQSALPTAVSAANDRADAISDLFGRILTAHIPPGAQVHKAASYTSTQTGAVLWDPSSGKKIAVTHITIGTGGTTAGRLTLWFGANGDTTYSEGTDKCLFDGDLVPSANAAPGVIICPQTPFFAETADHELHVTTSAGMTVRIQVWGYEY